MRAHASIAVIIPALNEEAAVGQVISAIPAWVDEVIVVDNGSTDGTAGGSPETRRPGWSRTAAGLWGRLPGRHRRPPEP